MPLRLCICGTTSFNAMLTTLWFQFPKRSRDNKIFQIRFGYFLLSQILLNVFVWEYAIIGYVFVNVSEDYQWIPSLFLPIPREINGWILTKICYKAAESDDNNVRLSCLHYVGARHALFLAIALGL